MRKRATLLLAAAAILANLSAQPCWADGDEADNTPLTKVCRGAINTVTGWVEIPKRIEQTWDTDGAASGLTWGLLRGLGYGFVRTAAGIYEVVTFPFPAPPGYEPVIQPEFVFEDDSGGQENYDHP